MRRRLYVAEQLKTELADRFDPHVLKDYEDLLKKAAAASAALRWTRLLVGVAKGDAEPEPGIDPVYDRLYERLRKQTRERARALREVERWAKDTIGSWDPDLPLTMRSELGLTDLTPYSALKPESCFGYGLGTLCGLQRLNPGLCCGPHAVPCCVYSGEVRRLH